jgi:serine/threonine protein kinase
MEWMLNYNPRNRPKPNQVLAHAFFHPKTISTDNKVSLKTPNILTSQDTTAESKNRPGLVESLVIGQNNLQMKNRILKNASQLAGGPSGTKSDLLPNNSPAGGDNSNAAHHKYKSIDFGSEINQKQGSIQGTDLS